VAHHVGRVAWQLRWEHWLSEGILNINAPSLFVVLDIGSQGAIVLI
jgi:hypothetical protein